MKLTLEISDTQIETGHDIYTALINLARDTFRNTDHIPAIKTGALRGFDDVPVGTFTLTRLTSDQVTILRRALLVLQHASDDALDAVPEDIFPGGVPHTDAIIAELINKLPVAQGN